MPQSINGWPVISPNHREMLATGTIPGTSRKLTTRKELLPLFLALASDYNIHVTSIEKGSTDEGGWNYRPSRMNSSWSNHSSGTAIDIDWAHEGSQNPRNLLFTDANHPKHHSGIQFMKHKYGEIMNWGGDWGIGHQKKRYRRALRRGEHVSTSAFDPMHWEIKKGVSLSDVKHFIKTHGIRQDGTSDE